MIGNGMVWRIADGGGGNGVDDVPEAEGEEPEDEGVIDDEGLT